MLFQKKDPVRISLPSRSLKKELDYLYARRSAINNLIECLEDYTRFKASASRNERRKTA